MEGVLEDGQGLISGGEWMGCWRGVESGMGDIDDGDLVTFVLGEWAYVG